MPYQPRKFKPVHVQIVRLCWQGYSAVEIAQFLGISEIHVRNIINCDEAQAMLSQMKEHAINSSDEIQDEAQLVAPLVMREKIRLALEAGDERVRNVACSDILAIAGHTAVKKLEISRSENSRDDLTRKTPRELQEDILKDMGIDATKAPDGTLLN
jgi:hypothetical protein